MTTKDSEENIVDMFDDSYTITDLLTDMKTKLGLETCFTESIKLVEIVVTTRKVTDTTTQLRDIEEKLIRALAEANILKETNSILHSECCILEENVKRCQERLDSVCDLENKIWKLEEDLANTNQSLQTEVSQHQSIIESLQKDHAKEIEEAVRHIKAECSQEITKITSHWKEAEDAKSTLEFQLRASESERKKVVARITMEYESKLLKVSRQNADFLQQHHQVMNQDAIRKKMQHMKENYDCEVASLKAQIVDLQQRLESTPAKSEVQNKNPSHEKQKQSKLKLLPHHYIFQEKQCGKRSGPLEPACRPDRKKQQTVGLYTK